jgi:hypothetical protein
MDSQCGNTTLGSMTGENQNFFHIYVDCAGMGRIDFVGIDMQAIDEKQMDGLTRVKMNETVPELFTLRPATEGEQRAIQIHRSIIGARGEEQGDHVQGIGRGDFKAS